MMLVGILKKNAIMQIDFARDAERAGKSPTDATYKRGNSVARVNGNWLQLRATEYELWREIASDYRRLVPPPL
jgi:hypothetical protein